MPTFEPLFDPLTEGGQVSPDPPQPLYHYTSPHGLKGIFETGTLRCSSAHHLSDAAELRFGVEKTAELIKKIRQDFRNGTREHEFPEEGELLAKMQRMLGKISELEVFIGSFSREGDLLSQWRAYCPDSGGYAIGFDTKSLAELAAAQNFNLYQCVYSENEYGPELEDTVHDTLSAYRTHRREEGDEAQRPEKLHATSFLWILLDLATRAKHPAFKEEHEWRLVSSRKALTEKPIKFWKGTSTLIPYMPFELDYTVGGATDEGADTVSDIPFPISEIIVGPTPHPDLAKRSVEKLAEYNGIYGISVTKSEIPYRAW